MLFYCYNRCSTCQKAKKYLDANSIEYTLKEIKEDHPTLEEIKKYHALANVDIKKLFNTSGNLYKELHLKDNLKTMSDEEKYELLASDGMLVKRPILVLEDKVVFGYKEEIYKDIFKIG